MYVQLYMYFSLPLVIGKDHFSPVVYHDSVTSWASETNQPVYSSSVLFLSGSWATPPPLEAWRAWERCVFGSWGEASKIVETFDEI